MVMDVRELFENFANFDAKKITVQGWIRTIRESKALVFIELNDGGYFRNIQIVIEEKSLSNFKEVAGLNVGSAVKVQGTLLLTPQAKQPFEIKACEVSVEGESTPDYPLQKKRHSLEYLRTIAISGPDQYLFRGISRTFGNRVCHPRLFPQDGFFYMCIPLLLREATAKAQAPCSR
jgi:asparaginyl-tRNA synthetase